MRKRQTSNELRLGPLSTHELSARRADVRRRRRTRRRALLGFVVLLAAAGASVLAFMPGGAARRPPLTHAGVGPPRFVAPRTTRSGARPAGGLYRSVDHVLGYTPYVRLGGSRRREVALTFDDGPGPWTSSIIRVLRRTHTPATFFVIGRQVPEYRQVVATEARDGFDIGDHTEIHPFMSALSASVQQTQIAEAANAIQAAGAPYPRLFRPPYGSFDAATLAVLHAARMLMVLWTVDTSDYARPGVARIVYVALSGLRSGAIILMHDGGGDRSETVQALGRIIRGIRRRGYRPVTMAQLLADDPPPHGQPPPHPLSGTG